MYFQMLKRDLQFFKEIFFFLFQSFTYFYICVVCPFLNNLKELLTYQRLAVCQYYLGMEPTSPALAGQLFTTEPPRKLKNPFTFYKTRSRVSGTVKVIRPPWWGQIGYSAHFRVPEEQGCFQDTGVEGQSQTHCWTFLKTMLA